MTTKVLIVDDQPMFRIGLRAIVESASDLAVVGEAGDGDEAVRRARDLNPDVILMDVRMPVLNGIDATRTVIRGAGSVVPKVIVLTTFDIDDYVYDALRAGASGFLLKDAAPDEILSAVRTVAAGEALLAPSVTRRLIEEFVSSSPGRLASTTVFDGLTDREREVFRLIATGHSNREIGRTLFIAEQTAKTHVSRILSKLGIPDRVHAVVLGYETGLIKPGSV